MKKSMIIAIIVVYIISIVAVNFFGLEMKDFEGLIYATDFAIEIIQPDEDGDKIGEIGKRLAGLNKPSKETFDYFKK